MTAVFRVNLRETKHLRVCKTSTKACRQTLKILYLYLTEGKTLFLIVFANILDMNNSIWLLVYSKYHLIESLVKHLQHRVKLSILIFYLKIFLNTKNTFETHVLSNFNCISTPWSNHLPTRTNKKTVYFFTFDSRGSTEKPFQLFNILGCHLLRRLYNKNLCRFTLEKQYHHCLVLISY